MMKIENFRWKKLLNVYDAYNPSWNFGPLSSFTIRHHKTCTHIILVFIYTIYYTTSVSKNVFESEIQYTGNLTYSLIARIFLMKSLIFKILLRCDKKNIEKNQPHKDAKKIHLPFFFITNEFFDFLRIHIIFCSFFDFENTVFMYKMGSFFYLFVFVSFYA